MKRELSLLLLLPLLPAAGVSAPIRWAAYYSETQPAGGLTPFDLLVLDNEYFPPLQPLLKRGATVLGYISVGEVEHNRYYFKDVRAQGLLLGENADWKGSYYVDVRDRRWRDRVRSVVRETLRKGFTGVFLDTVDNAEYLEAKDPVKFRGMNSAMAALILDIRKEFPGIRIAVNRGFSILSRIAPAIDYELAESVYTTYDFGTRKHSLVPQDAYRQQVELLQAARRHNPRLQILSLDYWNPADRAGISRIYEAQRANGFHPYVSTIALDTIVEEPVSR
jgi:polysaccharide biosynthesis protein PelA